MKKVSIISLFLSLIVLAWCGKTLQDNQVLMSQNEIPAPELTTTTWMIAPLCVQEQSVESEIIVMDSVVKNCTQQQKEWMFLDWLGWVCPEYVIYNNQVLTSIYNPETIKPEDIICQTSDWVGYIIPPQNGFNTDIPSNDILQKVIGKWFVQTFEPKCYPDTIYCQEQDTECTSMIDYGGWTDGIQYFVAGTRNTSDGEAKKVYVINDKIYDPWQSSVEGGIMKDSKRNFVSIQNNKIIVRKISWSKINGNPNLQDPSLDPSTIKTDYTLKTCEIDL